MIVTKIKSWHTVYTIDVLLVEEEEEIRAKRRNNVGRRERERERDRRNKERVAAKKKTPGH